MMADKHNQSVMVNIQPVTSGDAPIVDITQVLAKGRELQCTQSSVHEEAKIDRIRPIWKQCQRPDCPACTIRKIEYPEEPPVPECRHYERTVVSRVGINRRQHLKLLASPNPTRLMKPCWPTMVERPIHCATYRLATLAEPRPLSVHCTWQRFANVLDPYHIENCRKRMLERRFTGTNTAVEYFTQKQRYAQFRRTKRKLQIRELRKQISQLRRRRFAQHGVNILRALFLHSRSFLLANNVQLLTTQRLQMSRHILTELCRFLGYAKPKRGSKVFYDTFLVNLADNLAIWLSSFAANSRYEVRDEVNADGVPIAMAGPVQRLQDVGECADSVAIDDYVDYSTDDVSSAECTESEFRGGEDGEGEAEGEDWSEEEVAATGVGEDGKL